MSSGWFQVVGILSLSAVGLDLVKTGRVILLNGFPTQVTPPLHLFSPSGPVDREGPLHNH